MKRPYKMLIVTALILTFALASYYFNGLEGEVFLVTKDGKALPAPGASIELFRGDGGKSLSGFWSASHAALNRHGSRLREYTKMAETAQRQGRTKPEVAEAFLDVLKLEERVYCEDLESVGLKYFGRPQNEIHADPGGKFSLKLMPGHYTLSIRGQAGSTHALWVEEVRLLWRSRVRIVEPVCQYSTE